MREIEQESVARAPQTQKGVGAKGTAAWDTMLPKLLYWGDVPVESSYHGSALLFRLLESYPHERLAILEGSHAASVPERRLKEVIYQHLPPQRLLSRLQRSRLHSWVCVYLVLAQRHVARRAASQFADFQPDAVLTVAHDFSWLAGAWYAHQKQLPLHLIVHDDWPGVLSVPPGFRRWAHRCFKKVYQQAASRLCVSPAMEQEYRLRYSTAGEVLYPSRGLTCGEHTPISLPWNPNARRFRVAFAGTLSTVDYSMTLVAVAAALDELDGELLVYGPLDEKQATSLGLNRGNIKIMGLVPNSELVSRMREEANVLLVPMSFNPSEEMAMRLNFPSKLTDYTAAGLPILIVGPKSSSAVQWSESHPGVALALASRQHEVLAEGLRKLAGDDTYRLELAAAAGRVGSELFSPQVAQHVLYSRLMAEATPTPAGSR